MLSKRCCVICAAAVGTALSASANATVLDFILEWSGESFDNNASAVGSISIDDSVFLNPGHNNVFENPGWVTALSITITGSIGGDGTWTLEDFDDVVLDTDYAPLPPLRGGGGPAETALDLTQELVGQPTSQSPWGTPTGEAGDFNLFSDTAGVPTGDFYFTLLVGGGGGDRGAVSERLLLTSFRPVPAPSSLALCGVAAGVLARRRRV